MLLEGSCHCEAVTFTLQSRTPYPFMRCYCSICRKTGGGGGYAINIMGEAKSFKVKGREHVTRFHATVKDEHGKKTKSGAWRHFCARCGSSLWLSDKAWPEWIYPLASAIDTPLPTPPDDVEIMLDHAAPWADVPRGAKHKHYREYPKESIAGWHKSRKLETG